MDQDGYAKKTIDWGHLTLEIQGKNICLSAGYGFGYPYMRTSILHKLDTIEDASNFLQKFCHKLENDLYDPDKRGFEFLPNWTDEDDWRPLERKMKVGFELRENGHPYISFTDRYYDSPGFRCETELDSILPPDEIGPFVKKIKEVVQDLKDYNGYYFTE